MGQNVRQTMLALPLLLAKRGRSGGISWVGSDALVWDAARLRIAVDAAGIALWSWNVDTGEIAMDEHGHVLWEVPRDGPLTFEDLSSRIHPMDLQQVRAVFETTRATPGAFDVDFRILLHNNKIRWISARGRGADEGIVDRIMFGAFLDITERKQAEEAREMLAREMSHRVKNLFAIASSLTSIAARSAATTTEMARDLRQRLATLGRAHDLIRGGPGDEGHQGALLGDLFSVLLAPYDDHGTLGDRIHVSVPEVRVGETSATALALIIHELGTNSVKYGSLSVERGTLDVSCADHDGEVAIVWTERGGPLVSAPTRSEGFGSQLVARSVSHQLGGSIAYDWLPEGAVITLRMSKVRLAA